MEKNTLFLVFLKCVGAGLVVGGVFGPLIGLVAPELIDFLLYAESRNPVGVGFGLGVINGAMFGFIAAVIIAFLSKKSPE